MPFYWNGSYSCLFKWSSRFWSNWTNSWKYIIMISQFENSLSWQVIFGKVTVEVASNFVRRMPLYSNGSYSCLFKWSSRTFCWRLEMFYFLVDDDFQNDLTSSMIQVLMVLKKILIVSSSYRSNWTNFFSAKDIIMISLFENGLSYVVVISKSDFWCSMQGL